MPLTRRAFVRNVSLASAGLALTRQGYTKSSAPSFSGGVARLGFIGVGLRGETHLAAALRRSDVEVLAICDIDEGMLQRSKDIVNRSGKPVPKIFTGSDYAYRDLLQVKGLDGVIIATPWEWHAPMVLDSLAAGLKYVATEVILGITMEEIEQVVQAAEAHDASVMMLENVCYRRDVMAALNMVRQGVFGELLHLQAGYQHDLRGVLLNPGAEFGPKGFSEAKWRTNHCVHRNGDLYPTHGIGPVAMMIDINRGNRFMSLSSFATKTRGLHNYIVAKGGPDHPNAKVLFELGDIVTTHLKCANGETVILQHDTCNPRPYSLGFRVQGTSGLWMDVAQGVYIEGVSKEEDWDPAADWFKKYDHPLWQRWSASAEGAGHGGMDFFVLHAFIESIKRGVPTPMDVYDAAAWTAISPLSEASVQLGGEPVPFPDFTGGKWMLRSNTFATGNEF